MNLKTAMRLKFLIDVTRNHVASLKAQPRRDAQAIARLAELLRSFWDDAAQSVLDHLLESGTIPTNDLSRAQVASIVEALLEPFSEAITDEALASAAFGYQRTVEDLAANGISAAFEGLPDELVERIRAGVFEASETTLARVTGDVLDNLAESAAEGLGINDAAERLKEVTTNMRGYELERIARTEIQGAQNAGAHEALIDFDITFEQWVSAGDSRVRDSHADLDGEITYTGDRFSNGLRFPGDRSGDIEEWVNCRCRSVAWFLPEGKLPPPGRNRFFERDLADVA